MLSSLARISFRCHYAYLHYQRRICLQIWLTVTAMPTHTLRTTKANPTTFRWSATQSRRCLQATRHCFHKGLLHTSGIAEQHLRIDVHTERQDHACHNRHLRTKPSTRQRHDHRRRRPSWSTSSSEASVARRDG